MNKTFFAIALVVVGSFSSMACHHDEAPPPNNPGPMQKAGAAVDHGAQNVKDATEDTAHDVKEDLKK